MDDITFIVGGKVHTISPGTSQQDMGAISAAVMSPAKSVIYNAAKQRSCGEQIVHDILVDMKIDFTEEKTFDDLYAIEQLRFDFYFVYVCGPYPVKCAIEFDGSHHKQPVCYDGISEDEALLRLEKQVLYDGIKDGYAKENDIRLLRIPIASVRRSGVIVKGLVKAKIKKFLDDISDEYELLG